jgi:hypothetical protein
MFAENCGKCGVTDEAQQARGEEFGHLAGALLGGEMLGGEDVGPQGASGWSCPQRPSRDDPCAVWRGRGTTQVEEARLDHSRGATSCRDPGRGAGPAGETVNSENANCRRGQVQSLTRRQFREVTPPGAFEALQKAAQGLRYTSETDAPLEAFAWETTGPLSPQRHERCVKVFKAGFDSTKDAYIVGTTADGKWAGLRTVVVET